MKSSTPQGVTLTLPGPHFAVSGKMGILLICCRYLQLPYAGQALFHCYESKVGVKEN